MEFLDGLGLCKLAKLRSYCIGTLESGSYSSNLSPHSCRHLLFEINENQSMYLHYDKIKNDRIERIKTSWRTSFRTMKLLSKDLLSS
ncbi:hypothetical protein C5167_031789, partial [Papaver somniferum]